MVTRDDLYRLKGLHPNCLALPIAEALLTERDEALKKLETSKWLDDHPIVKQLDTEDPKALRNLFFWAADEAVGLKKEVAEERRWKDAYREVAITLQQGLASLIDAPLKEGAVDSEAKRIVEGMK